MQNALCWHYATSACANAHHHQCTSCNNKQQIHITTCIKVEDGMQVRSWKPGVFLHSHQFYKMWMEKNWKENDVYLRIEHKRPRESIWKVWVSVECNKSKNCARTHAYTHAQCRQVTEITAKLQVQIDFYCTTFSTTIPINHVGNEAHKLPIHEMVKKDGRPDTCHRRELIENYGFFPLRSNTNTRIHVTAAARIVFLSSLSWNSIRNLITIAIVTIFKLSRHFPCVHCAVARRNKKCVFPSFLRSIYQKNKNVLVSLKLTMNNARGKNQIHILASDWQEYT